MFTKEIFALLIVNASNSRYTSPHDRHIRPPTHDRHLSARFENSPQATLYLQWTPLCNAFIKTQLPLNISLCFVPRQCKIFPWYTTARPPHTTTNARSPPLCTLWKQSASNALLAMNTPLQRLYQNAVAVELFVVFCSSSMQDFSVIHHRTTATYDHQRTIATSLHALKTDRKQRFSCNEHPFATPLHKRPPKAQIQIAPTGKQRKRRLCFLGIVFRLFIW